MLGGVGAVFAESEVVLGRSAIVAVAADDDFDGGVGAEIAGGLGDGGSGVGTEIVAVVVEEDVLRRSGGRRLHCPCRLCRCGGGVPALRGRER